MPDHGSAAEVSPHQALLRMITGSWVAQAIYVAAKLQIADLTAVSRALTIYH